VSDIQSHPFILAMRLSNGAAANIRSAAVAAAASLAMGGAVMPQQAAATSTRPCMQQRSVMRGVWVAEFCVLLDSAVMRYVCSRRDSEVVSPARASSKQGTRDTLCVTTVPWLQRFEGTLQLLPSYFRRRLQR